jgi:hypothetical protein
MNRRSILAVVAAIAIAAAALSAEPEEKKIEGPKPAPELEKLAYFLGPWNSEGEFKDGPAGPGGPFKGREVCRWMPGNFFMGCMMQIKGPMGMLQTQGILGYDTEKKVYQWWSFNNLGQHETATASLKDGVWTWLGELRVDGKTVKSRYTMSDTTPAGYASRLESSPDGKTWTLVMTGKVERMQTAERKAATPGPGVKPPAGVPEKKDQP